MNNLFFVYNNEKYIIEYIDKVMNIYKEINGERVQLTENEKEKIKSLLNSKNSYTYNSSMLNNMVFRNSGIERKEYVINFLNWMERVIPQECRNNLYRNIQSLRTNLNMNLNMSRSETYSTGYSTVAGYNTRSNVLIIDEKSLQELWRIAQTTQNPQDFYSRHYAQTLLHELLHMASSNYNYQTGVSLCGFDRHPAQEERDKNRGLTEGFTEVISMAGVPNTVEISSRYYIEGCLINQIVQIIGNEAFFKSYFSNLGTYPMEFLLNQLIDEPGKSYQLFRDIELNFDLRGLCEEQNILGSIQMSLLDYLDAKLDIMIEQNTIEEITNVLQTYESMLITPDKLRMMNQKPQNYYGIVESISKFDAIRTKCLRNMKDSRRNIA